MLLIVTALAVVAAAVAGRTLSPDPEWQHPAAGLAGGLTIAATAFFVTLGPG